MNISWQVDSLKKLTAHPGRFYSYAPSAMSEGNIVRLWWCQNETDGIVKDSIFYDEFTATSAVFTAPPRPAFRAANPPAWDSFHVCDPSVVMGDFRYAKTSYRFALFYLGNDVNASRHNQIGVAFSNAPDGPWVRYPAPLVSHADDGSWGVGQPSAINYDQRGMILLFYTQGDREGTRQYLQNLDLKTDIADASQGDGTIGAPVQLSTRGLKRTDGSPDYLNNADFAYHRRSGRMIVVREQRPMPPDAPSFIGASLQIASCDADTLLRGQGVWQVEGEITPDLTGLARNHNAGIVRDPYGALPDNGRIGVVFSSSAVSKGLPGRPEWTYDLWRIEGLFR